MGESIPSTITRLVAQYHLKPKKSLGQNFLVDRNIYDKILDAAKISDHNCVLEIGSGLGTLTKMLAERSGGVVAIETDAQLIPLLKHELASFQHCTVVHGSALDLPLDTMLSHCPKSHHTWKIVANIPYYITGKILRRFLPISSIEQIVLLVQYEVAERMCAHPGMMSMLALTAQWYANVTIVARVSRNSFYPSPRVDSAIIKLDRYKKNPLSFPKGISEEEVFRLAKVAFNQKRKQIANSLAAGLHLKNTEASTLLKQTQISPKSRPQDLSIDDWVKIADVFSQRIKK